MVNEIDTIRNKNLQKEGCKGGVKGGGTEALVAEQASFQAVLANPPFGKLDKAILYDTFPIRTLEHLMALRALDTLVAYGRAAIIIGGHTHWDEKGRIQAGRNRIFFNYLYSRYHVLDVINIDGHKLYARQGTAFDVRLILIDGRKTIPSGNAPVRDQKRDGIVNSFDELFERLIDHLPSHPPKSNAMVNLLELEAEALALELDLLEIQVEQLGSPDAMDIDRTFYEKYLAPKKKYSNTKIVLLLQNSRPGLYETYDRDAETIVSICKGRYTQDRQYQNRRVYGLGITSYPAST